MSTDLRARQPKGIPVGGQFAATSHAESDLALDEDLLAEARVEAEYERRYAEQAKWGDVSNVREDSRTPWGAAQTAHHVAPGIVQVSTAGHGGIKVSKERNALIPPALRNNSGWYEEDCEAAIVGMYHPEVMPHYQGGDHDAIREACTGTVKNWFPDQYEKATGTTVTAEESYVRRDQQKAADKAAFRAAHADDFVTLGNGDTHAAWIPTGFAVTRARKDATGEERHFLVPRDEVIHDSMWGKQIVVDPNRHLDVTGIENLSPDRPWVYAPDTVDPLHGEAIGIDYSGLTAAQADRARSELGKVWRFHNDDGTTTTESLGAHLARVGVVGKKPYVDGDKVTYSVQFEGSRVTRVSKATYDALTGVPDTSDDSDRAYVAKERARVKYERVKAAMYDSRNLDGWRAKRDKAESEYQAAVARHRALSDSKSEQARAWQAERDEMRIKAMRDLLDERGIEL
ncbi:DUF7007 domain-containing protein [Nocardioides pakistanensis]